MALLPHLEGFIPIFCYWIAGARLSQRELIARAFAADDVEADFAAEKAADTEQELPSGGVGPSSKCSASWASTLAFACHNMRREGWAERISGSGKTSTCCLVWQDHIQLLRDLSLSACLACARCRSALPWPCTVPYLAALVSGP